MEIILHISYNLSFEVGNYNIKKDKKGKRKNLCKGVSGKNLAYISINRVKVVETVMTGIQHEGFFRIIFANITGVDEELSFAKTSRR